MSYNNNRNFYNDDEDGNNLGFGTGISRLGNNQERGGEYYAFQDQNDTILGGHNNNNNNFGRHSFQGNNQFTNSNNINNSEGIEMLSDPSGSLTGSVIHVNNNNSNNSNNKDSNINIQQNQQYQHYSEDQTLLEKNSPSLPPIHNLDIFLTDVYTYFRGKGFICIFFNGLFDLLLSLFVVLFFTFLVCFIDYSLVFSNESQSSLYDAVNFQRPIPLWLMVFLGIFSFYWVYKFMSFLYTIKSSLEMKSFYWNSLGINEDEVQTIEWREIVSKLSKVNRISNVSTDELTALEIANRIMRKDNYLIHLVNHKVFDLRIPFPILNRYQFVTKSIEWCLVYSLFNYIFDENGVIKKEFLDVSNRHRLTVGLERRFFAIGLIGFFAAPFIFFFLLINFFFEYAEAIKNNPGSLFSREWTSYAKWEFREYNELPHYFQNRLNLSYTHANAYIESFPSEFLSHTAKFASYILGSFLAVLIVFGIYNDNFLLNFQIFGRTAIWYVGILGTAVAVARALITDNNQVFQPVKHMARTYQHTHYLPKSWKGRAHTHSVRNEFLELFEYRLVAFIKEILSVALAPFILMFSLPKCASNIINEVGRSTVLAEGGLGLITQNATFTNVKRLGGTHKYGTFSSNSTNIVQGKQGKVVKSMTNFKAHNPEWKPENNEYFDDINKFTQLRDLQEGNSMTYSMVNGQKPISNSAPNTTTFSRIIPPNTSVDDFQYIYDSHYINPKIFKSIMGNPDDEENKQYLPNQIDQGMVNSVNSVNDAFYQYLKSQNQIIK